MPHIPSLQGFPDLDLLGSNSVSLPDEPSSLCGFIANLQNDCLNIISSVFSIKMYLPPFPHTEDHQTKSQYYGNRHKYANKDCI